MFRTSDSTERSFADNVDGNRGWARDILLDGIIQKPSDGVTTATVLSIGGAFERMTVRNCYSEKPGYFIGASSDVTGRTDTCDLLVDGFRLGENPTRMLDLQESGKVLNLSLVNTQWPGGTIVRNLTGGTLRTVDCDIPFLLTDVTSKEVGDKLKQTTGWREWSGTQWRALGFDPLSEGYRCRRLTWFQPSGPTWSSGTGATTSLAIPEEGRADCGTALSGYAKLFAQTGVSGFSAFSGAAWSFETAGAVEVSAALVVSSNAASRARLMVGVENTRVSPLADSDALSANGLGLEIRRTASQWEARLVSYSSSTFTASSWAQIQSNVSSTMRSLRIDWDGLGNATLRASTVGGSRGTRALASTPIATLTGTVPTTAAGRGAMWEVVNPASGTAANFQTHVLPINFVTEPN